MWKAAVNNSSCFSILSCHGSLIEHYILHHAETKYTCIPEFLNIYSNNILQY